MGKSKITLYVDIVSPFAYMGYYALRHHPAFHSVQINYIPIFLGGLMKACNNTPPIQIKNKGTWINVGKYLSEALLLNQTLKQGELWCCVLFSSWKTGARSALSGLHRF